jgi:hypothetical protein
MINSRATDIIPIYDSSGNQVEEIKLKERIMPIPTKRGGFSESGMYYKGARIVYRNHLECNNERAQKIKNGSEVQIIGKTGLVYENLIACNLKLVGRFGIFTFKHQPIFSDYEGGCGVKEQKFVNNQKEFQLNAIEEITDVIPTGIENHNIYCYRLKELKGGIADTVNLIRYVLINDWNTAWDKNLWEDIECFGFVRDVADWFKSKEFKHKLGTVYALLNSLYRSSMKLYAQLLLEIFGNYDFNKKMILYYSAGIVKKYCDEYSDMELKYDTEPEIWFKKLYKELVSGNACCHLEDDDKWNWVREYYKNKLILNGGN